MKGEEAMERGITNRYDDFNNYNYEQIKFAVSVLSKTANQRLRQIEKTGLTNASNAYRYIEGRAYDEELYMDMTKKGEMKFRTNYRDTTLNGLREQMGVLQEFLFKSKTSTVTGVKNKYLKGYETAKKNNPELFGKMSFNEFGDLWNTFNMKQILKMYGSDIVVKFINEAESQGLSKDDINEIMSSIDEHSSYLGLISQINEKKERKKLSTANLDTSIL